MELRSFTFGMMAGIGIFIGTLLAVSQIAGIYWQPIKVEAR